MRRAALLAIALMLAITGGCGEADDDDGGGGGEASSGEPISLSVGIDSVYAPMFLAQTEGLFEEHGVNVNVRQFAQGGEGMDAMVAGNIDTAGSADSTVLARAAREDIRALGIFVEDKGNYVKLVTREGIDDPSQIKRMGIVPGSISEYGAFKLLRSEGIDPASVELIPTGPPELPALLEQGDVDGFVIWEPWPTQAEEMGGKVLMKSGEFDLSYVLVVAARKEWLDGHRKEAQAIMDALAEAADQVEQDPEAAAEAAGAQAKLPPEQVEQAVADLEFEVRGFEQSDTATWGEIADFLVERDLVAQKPDVEEVLSDDVVSGG
jgi:ABC-type nitrate/sulfonate/bicarbonate transport system substrate-binding protein